MGKQRLRNRVKGLANTTERVGHRPGFRVLGGFVLVYLTVCMTTLILSIGIQPHRSAHAEALSPEVRGVG